MTSRVILVTGANGSLGRSLAQSFLESSPSDHLVLGYHQQHDSLDSLAAAHPDRVTCLALDVTQPEAWRQTVALLEHTHRRLDVLINNAGFHEDHLLATMPTSAWDRVRTTNLDSVFHGCQAVLPTMIAQKAGRIVNIASLSALLAPPGQTNYAAAKAGVLALTQSLAKEVARLGITVNAVCPGYLDGPSTQALSPEVREAARQRVPMRRFGQPAEVAAAVRFLAGPDASYITGSVLKIDGGIL